MIIVTGATGHLGRAILQQLAQRVPTSQLGASCRDPEQAADLSALGVRVRRGDFADPASLHHAFEGASQVLLVSSNARDYGGDAIAQHSAAIEAARSVGAARVVYTSHMAVSDRSAFPPMVDHHATEHMLRDSGLAWTALRNGFYASSGVALLGDAFTSGIVAAPADGKVCWTTHADLAEAAAILLTRPEPIDGPTPPLTAPQALDLAELAALLSELQGRPVHRTILPDDALRAQMTAHGVPPSSVDLVLGLYLACRSGEFEAVDPTLTQLLGRPTTSMRDVLAAALQG